MCGKGIFVALCRIWSVLLFALLDGGGGGRAKVFRHYA